MSLAGLLHFGVWARIARGLVGAVAPLRKGSWHQKSAMERGWLQWWWWKWWRIFIDACTSVNITLLRKRAGIPGRLQCAMPLQGCGEKHPCKDVVKMHYAPARMWWKAATA